MERDFFNGKCSLNNSKDLCGCALIDGEIACIECLERQAEFESKCSGKCETCGYADYSTEPVLGRTEFNCTAMD